MISPQSTLEREAVDALERRLSGQGYTLQREPEGEKLPPFLGAFRPDAIATGKMPNLLIEVITQRGSGEVETTKVRQHQQLLEGHPDWKLENLYTTSSSPLPGLASIGAIHRRFDEVEVLARSDRPAALVVAWSLLEAIARSVVPERAVRGLLPATTVELLTSLGYVVQSEAYGLRAAAQARNLIVHGDVDQDVSPELLGKTLDIIGALIRHLERQAPKG